MADAIGQGGGFEIRSRGDVSDHGPFALRGRPAALLFSGVTDYYHSPDDTPDRLKLEDIRRSGDLVLALVRGLAPEDGGGLRATP